MKLTIRRYRKIKKRYLVGIIVIVVLIIGGIGGKMYMDNKEEQQLIEWERVAAKQMKNTFADLKEIHFSKEYTTNKLAGFVDMDVLLITEKGKITITISLPGQQNKDTLRSYGYGYGGEEVKRGKTSNEVIIYYSNSQKEGL